VTQILALVLGLVPVVLFLAGLLALDSFKLVTRAAVLRSLGWGALAALIALALNVTALAVLRLDPDVLKRYVAPPLEEVLKAAWVVLLIRRARVGFLVDAGIHGFAVGTGFALAENVYYAWQLGNSDPLLWIVRGLGTAVLHGSTTAVVAILGKRLADLHEAARLGVFAPGLALVTVVHSLFNHLVLHPLLFTALLLVSMPLLVFVVFERSEHATRDWLGAGLDDEVGLIEQVHSGAILDTPRGEYLHSLRTRFDGSVVADMLCWLETYLELALRAKGAMIARAAGIEVPPDPEVRARMGELRYLERSIGATGRLALMPLLPAGRRDLWQIQMLERGRVRKRR
jgi:protease PrsW